jgi:hypothetical protein
MSLMHIVLIPCLLAKYFTCDETGILLAPLCKAAAAAVRDVFTVEALGRQICKRGLPRWHIQWIAKCINEKWPADEDLSTIETLSRRAWCDKKYEQDLNMTLTSLVQKLHHCLGTTSAPGTEIRDIEFEFSLELELAGKQPSILGCHILKVRDPEMFLLEMQNWLYYERHRDGCEARNVFRRVMEGHAKKRNKWPPDTAVVLQLLQVLGLHVCRGRGMRFAVKDAFSPSHPTLTDVWEPLCRIRQFVAESLHSSRGWLDTIAE